ncbi:MAG: hypothetical protein JOZ98_03415 [Solirubrobacterales bacterium]|nr:hypothetical protein [Solirubrobacterales bacterium]MBV9797968.1 hypothetical protein [Solirubrobacterales bacterium]
MIVRFITWLAVIAAVCAGGFGLLPAAGASAAQPSPVADCNAHLRLTRSYTPQELQQGLNTMPADIKEYTDCYGVLQNQLLAEVGSGHVHSASATGSGGSFLPTPLLVVLGVLVVAAAGFGVVAVRRRKASAGGPTVDRR